LFLKGSNFFCAAGKKGKLTEAPVGKPIKDILESEHEQLREAGEESTQWQQR